MQGQVAVEGKKATFECVLSREDGKVTWYAGENPITSQVTCLVFLLFSASAKHKLEDLSLCGFY